MKISPAFKAYIKNLVFKRMSLWGKLFLVSLITAPVLLILFGLGKIKGHLIYILADCIFMLATIIILITPFKIIISLMIKIFLYDYRFFKKDKYAKTKIPNDISKIKSEVPLDVWVIIKQLDKRVIKLEEDLSPVKLALISFYLAIALAVAIPIIFLLLPKLLHQ